MTSISNAKVQKQQKLSFATKSLSLGKMPSNLETIKSVSGQIIRLCPDHLLVLERLIGLFFLYSSYGGEDMNLATAILTDLNRRKYPKYEVVRSGPVFKSRQDWLAFEEAGQLSKLLYELISEKEDPDVAARIEELIPIIDYKWKEQSGEIISDSSCYFLKRFTAGWVYTRCQSSLVGWLERQKRFKEAVVLLESLLSQKRYCHGRRGQWWDRLILNLSKHIKDIDQAKIKCALALEDEHVRTSSRLSLKRRLTKLEKESFDELPIAEMDIEGTLTADGVPGRKLIFQIDEDTVGSVEQLVLAHFAKDGWEGLHAESSIFTSLFGILFWDILFSPTPDVFQTPYQSSTGQ